MIVEVRTHVQRNILDTRLRVDRDLFAAPFANGRIGAFETFEAMSRVAAVGHG
jgi:hypothetical protein